MDEPKTLAARDQIAGLVKGLRVIEAFDSAHTRMTLTEVARLIGETRASVRRCLLTLCDLGYAQTDGKLFWLGHRALRVSYAYSSSTRLPRILQPALDGLCEHSRDSATLAVLYDGAAVVAARSTARRMMRVSLTVGARLPLHCSAAGRVLMAGLPREQWRPTLERLHRPALTAHTVTQVDALMELLMQVRENGFAPCDEEIEIGVRSIAVPIFDRSGALLASVSMSARSEKMSFDTMKDAYLPIMRRTQSWAAARIGSH